MAFGNGLLNLNAGEWDISQAKGGGFGDRMTGLLGDPMLQIGLGILANNNSRDFGQVVGRGAMQGMQNIQQQQQLAQQNRFRESQMKRFDRESQADERTQLAIGRYKIAHPEYADAIDIDPKAAMKALNPALNTVDPYKTLGYDEKGAFYFDTRTGDAKRLSIDGESVIKSTDSPMVRGNVKFAESQADALNKPNTDIPGMVTTDAQVTSQASGIPIMKFGQPQPPVFKAPIQQGAPANINSMRVPPQQQRGRDGKRLQILLAEQQAQGGAGKDQYLDAEISNVQKSLGVSGGIRVPTKAEDAAKVAQAQADVELSMKPQIDAATKTSEMNAESKAKAQQELPKIIASAETAISQIDTLIGSEDGRIKPHAGFDTAVGASSKYDPRNYFPGTEATSFNSRLEQLKGGAFLQAFNDLKGGGAITEMEGKAATSAIMRMNTATTEKEFVDAARDYQKSISGAVQRAKYKAGGGNIMSPKEGMPVSVTAPKQAINLLRMNPKLRDQFDAKYGAGAAAQVLGK